MGSLETFFEEEYRRTGGGSVPRNREDLAVWAWDRLGRFGTSGAGSPRLAGTTDGDGYVRHRFVLSAVAGLEFTAYLLVPDGPGPFPGVLALHGHGYGPEEIVGLGPVSGHRHFAEALVKRGVAVLAPGVIGFGDRRFEADREGDPRTTSSCQRMASQLLLQGKTLAGLRTAEALGALGFLRTRPEVAGRPVGLIGFSGGALVASWTALIDGGLDATVLAGFPNTFRDSLLNISHCIDNYIPGLLADTELPGLLGRLAPQPLFLESGSRDPIFPVAGFRRAVEAVGQAYAEAGVPGRFASDLFPGVHEVSGRRSFPWLVRTLGGQG